jgi:GrpB-like predicted nucleotidyltransferase (UPF0157 family)
MAAPSVTFQDYDPAYPEAFTRLADTIRERLPAVRLEHVGSTSVPGLGGRRTLDVALIAPPAAHEAAAAVLQELGYTRPPFAWRQRMFSGFVDLQGMSYPALVYVVDEDDAMLRGWVMLRDHLRTHPDAVTRYGEAKRAILSRGESAPSAYQRGKEAFLADLAAEAARSSRSI